jgi:hypothetical protein
MELVMDKHFKNPLLGCDSLVIIQFYRIQTGRASTVLKGNISLSALLSLAWQIYR